MLLDLSKDIRITTAGKCIKFFETFILIICVIYDGKNNANIILMLSCTRVFLSRLTHTLSHYYSQILVVFSLVALLKSIDIDVLIVDKYDILRLEI